MGRVSSKDSREIDNDMHGESMETKKGRAGTTGQDRTGVDRVIKSHSMTKSIGIRWL
jgi:hypothetical protein